MRQIGYVDEFSACYEQARATVATIDALLSERAAHLATKAENAKLRAVADAAKRVADTVSARTGEVDAMYALDVALRIGYADPPYPGQAKKHYEDHPDYAGEVNHEHLLWQLQNDGYDGWVLHTSSVALPFVLGEANALGIKDYRIMAWVKPFAAFKRNVPVAYAWEPVLVKPVRKPIVTGEIVMRDWCEMTTGDWCAESITMQRGLAGAKPRKVCEWLFHVLGAQPDDELVDLFPGTGAVTDAWEHRKAHRPLDFASSS